MLSLDIETDPRVGMLLIELASRRRIRINGPITRVVARTETFVKERLHAETNVVRARRSWGR